MFEKPYTRETILALYNTRQPFRDASCYYGRYKTIASVGKVNGMEYVTIERWYENGMHPGTNMTMEDAVRYLNSAQGLVFLPIYCY